MNRAVFLDRDGVINRERGEHTYKKQDFEFLPDLFETLMRFQMQGFLLIIITNQSGIAKGLYTHEELTQLHLWMLDVFNNKSIKIKEVFYCPHYTDMGKCLCRKPGSLMIEKALAKYNIDPLKSFMIGDKSRDVEAAEKLGVKGIKIVANSSLHLIQEFVF